MFIIPVYICLYRFCKTLVFFHRATYRASTGPRLGPDWASCKSRWEGHGKINIIQQTHKLAGYQDRRCKVRDTSSKDVISEEMSPKA